MRDCDAKPSSLVVPLSRIAIMMGRFSNEQRNEGEDAVWVLWLEELSQSP
jgi:hypothetical protein